MKLSMGIVGLPNVGKSTLFKLLTKQEINIANYPFATVDPNVGVVAVPDERLEKLNKMSESAKKIPAVVEFYDIAGLVKGAHEGEGLGNQFLANIRETDAIVHLVRCFRDGDIIHVDGEVNVLRDVEVINAELIFKDLETVDKRLGSLEREARTGDKGKIKDLETIKKIKEALEKGELIVKQGEDIKEDLVVKELNLLTAKEQIILVNGKESELNQEIKEKLESYFPVVVADLGGETDLSGLIKKSYEVLGLISFFTTGEDETRAWTIKSGTRAPAAAGVIHTDFEKKFIRAEMVGAEELIVLGGSSKAKQAGKLRLEGKDYVMRDGDVMEVRHG